MPFPTADVVIVAAGASTRMGGIDKVTAPIAGRPLLAWTLRPFVSAATIGRIVVVTAADRLEELRDADWLPPGVTLVAGGARRQESVAAGISAIDGGGSPADRVVLVHDAARPAVGSSLIRRVIEAANEHGAAIPALPIVETVKAVADGVVERTVDRRDLWTAQTPQAARLGIFREAYARFPPEGLAVFTDEAALLEACTIPVHVVPGQTDNIKVTHQVDLARAEEILHADRMRIGLGEDVHPFGPDASLRLGGIELAGAPRLQGHSDGDVVLHAVADAILGAAGLGDLGRLFPADDRTPQGIDSAELLSTVVARAREAGFAPANVDVTIVAARPRLGDRLDEMRDRIAQLIGVRPGDVSVKASTGNLSGAEGAGRAVAARAVVTLEPLP
jgi:2-C-methyl-D-erythritol 4-phosphate cytidylyltransferase / 2-C-methyl-D-erythritol 2,4-cyclodiphosphate synthase